MIQGFQIDLKASEYQAILFDRAKECAEASERCTAKADAIATQVEKVTRGTGGRFDSEDNPFDVGRGGFGLHPAGQAMAPLAQIAHLRHRASAMHAHAKAIRFVAEHVIVGETYRVPSEQILAVITGSSYAMMGAPFQGPGGYQEIAALDGEEVFS